MTHRTRLFLSSVLVVAACRAEAREEPVATYGPERIPIAKLPPYNMMPNGKLSPIDSARVYEDVRTQQTFLQQRGAMCPKEIVDRIEEFRRYPTCQLLDGLKYATIRDGTSRGNYVKLIELTDAGRQALAADLEDRGDRFVFAVARKEVAPGYVRFENAPNRVDRVVVTFNWRWAPLNALGKGLDLRARYSGRDVHQGRATYDLTADGWTFVELWLNSDTKDYMSMIGV